MWYGDIKDIVRSVLGEFSCVLLESQGQHSRFATFIHLFKKGKWKAKRQEVTSVEDVAALANLEEGWVTKLLSLPGDELTKLLGDIAHHGKIKTITIKKARTSLPLFSGAKWTDFSKNFGLPNKLENNWSEQVVTPVYSLPPSIHEIMFKAAWHTQDVYQERQV